MKWVFRIFSGVMVVLLLLVASTVNGALPTMVGAYALFGLMVTGPLYVLVILIDVLLTAIEFFSELGKRLHEKSNASSGRKADR